MGDKQAALSVIIPVYNGERFLGAALESALSQQVSYELIVVDDGSTDQTPHIARSFGDRVRYCRQDRGGPARARNRGLELAGGELIGFLDSDDLWPPGKLGLQLPIFEAQPRVDIVAGLTAWFWELPGGGRETKPHLTLTLGSAIFRRAVFERIGRFDERLKGDAEDVDLFVRARESGLVIHVLEEVTSLYRRHPESMTYGQPAAGGNLMTVLKRSLDRRRDKGDAQAELAPLRRPGRDTGRGERDE